MKKLCRPILVVTNKKDTNLFKKHNILYYTKGMITSGGSIQAYELILVSLDPDEKIEVGNKCIKFGNIYKGGYIEHIYSPVDFAFPEIDFKKIIATQSQLSPEYINQFVEEYNKNKINNIEIEMIDNGYEVDMEGVGGMDWGDTCWNSKIEPKLTNGFITVVKKPMIEQIIKIDNNFQAIENAAKLKYPDCSSKNDQEIIEMFRKIWIEGATSNEAKDFHRKGLLKEVKRLCSKAWLKQPNTSNMLEEFDL